MFPNKKRITFETNINKYIHYIYETYFTLDGNPVLSDCSFHYAVGTCRYDSDGKIAGP